MIKRQILALTIIFLIMGNLSFFLGGKSYTGASAVTIILGFIMLGAFFVSKLAERAALPLLTGYIIFGVLAGPAALNIIEQPRIAEFSLINTLAFAYIALSVGAEIEWNFLKRQGVKILGIGILNVSIVFTGILMVFYPLIHYGFPGFPSVPEGFAAAAALVMAAIGATTSPAATGAIVNETRAKGELTENTLGIVVTKDILVITLFTVVMAWIRGGGGKPLSADELLWTMAAETGLSLLAGALLGAFVALYIKTMGSLMLPFTFGVAVISGALSTMMHLNVLLLCVTTGFVVRNFSAEGHKFVRAIEKGALPIFIIFFSLAGAALDTGALRRMWAVALIYFAVRVALMYVATTFATRLLGASPLLRRMLWKGFVSQAGVSLGLALIVREQIPVWGGALATLIIAEITICEIIGPIIFKGALIEAGEALKQEESTMRRAAPPAEL
ncbi:MAG: cation:proton antiporter [Nitrospinae bacterium]|nr:cation:proton antiporter [Nitrospinota bacterium]